MTVFTYQTQEVVGPTPHDVTGTIGDVLASLALDIETFLDDNPDCRWINVGFSDDGTTVSNVAISRK